MPTVYDFYCEGKGEIMAYFLPRSKWVKFWWDSGSGARVLKVVILLQRHVLAPIHVV